MQPDERPYPNAPGGPIPPTPNTMTYAIPWGALCALAELHQAAERGRTSGYAGAVNGINAALRACRLWEGAIAMVLTTAAQRAVEVLPPTPLPNAGPDTPTPDMPTPPPPHSLPPHPEAAAIPPGWSGLLITTWAGPWGIAGGGVRLATCPECHALVLAELLPDGTNPVAAHQQWHTSTTDTQSPSLIVTLDQANSPTHRLNSADA